MYTHINPFPASSSFSLALIAFPLVHFDFIPFRSRRERIKESRRRKPEQQKKNWISGSILIFLNSIRCFWFYLQMFYLIIFWIPSHRSAVGCRKDFSFSFSDSRHFFVSDKKASDLLTALKICFAWIKHTIKSHTKTNEIVHEISFLEWFNEMTKRFTCAPLAL